ncbi:uncharacterized protein LOC121390671 [Gigantopelta aegis]|uniref:uncharacterized protein LOC121390671 n=1 Tax=Gigantopelta aegis TaxID=1735272 RepID=UPI001B88B00C|nr:uncharacterized protein LOC121390671 [Gigantopelta aegis]
MHIVFLLFNACLVTSHEHFQSPFFPGCEIIHSEVITCTRLTQLDLPNLAIYMQMRLAPRIVDFRQLNMNCTCTFLDLLKQIEQNGGILFHYMSCDSRVIETCGRVTKGESMSHPPVYSLYMGHVFDMAAPDLDRELTHVFGRRADAVRVLRLVSMRDEYQRALEEAVARARSGARPSLPQSAVSKLDTQLADSKVIVQKKSANVVLEREVFYFCVLHSAVMVIVLVVLTCQYLYEPRRVYVVQEKVISDSDVSGSLEELPPKMPTTAETFMFLRSPGKLLPKMSKFPGSPSKKSQDKRMFQEGYDRQPRDKPNTLEARGKHLPEQQMFLEGPGRQPRDKPNTQEARGKHLPEQPMFLEGPGRQPRDKPNTREARGKHLPEQPMFLEGPDRRLQGEPSFLEFPANELQGKPMFSEASGKQLLDKPEFVKSRDKLLHNKKKRVSRNKQQKDRQMNYEDLLYESDSFVSVADKQEKDVRRIVETYQVRKVEKSRQQKGTRGKSLAQRPTPSLLRIPNDHSMQESDEDTYPENRILFTTNAAKVSDGTTPGTSGECSAETCEQLRKIVSAYAQKQVTDLPGLEPHNTQSAPVRYQHHKHKHKHNRPKNPGKNINMSSIPCRTVCLQETCITEHSEDSGTKSQNDENKETKKKCKTLKPASKKTRSTVKTNSSKSLNSTPRN